MLQFQSDILRIPVNRAKCRIDRLRSIAPGGLAIGEYKDLDSIKRRWESDRIFTPGMDSSKCGSYIRGWHRAVERAKSWEEN